MLPLLIINNTTNVNAILHIIAYVTTIVLIILSVAFFTVLERKVLAAIQRRRGPNASGLWGLLQALADGIKLLLKEPLLVSGANFYIFLFAPIVLLSISLTIWVLIPLPGADFNASQNYSFLALFLFSGLNSYAVILSGLSSNSRYSLIGGVRAIAQVISYEIPMSVCLLCFSCLEASFNLHNYSGSRIVFAIISAPAFVIFFITLLAETNRTPFDLPEAEAELVAGYNLEYSSILFSLFFLAEYSNILVACSMLSILFCYKYFYVSVIFFSLVIIVIRGILPRYTFGQLIGLCWKVLFPISIATLTFTVTALFFIDSSADQFVDPSVASLASEIVDKSVKAASDKSKLNLSSIMPGLKVILFFIIAFCFSAGLVLINWAVVNFRSNNRKNSPYECGFEPLGSPVSNFEPNFTVVAVAFLVYDVEVLLTYPWVIGMHGKPFGALVVFLFFIVLLLVSYAYEVLDGAFDI